MDESSGERIVIPQGNFDDRETAPVLNEENRPPFKPLAEVVLPEIGKYEIGVYGDFESDSFKLFALDEDKQEIPLLTFNVSEDNGEKVFTPTENTEAIEFFGAFTDMDEVKKNFEPELDSWIKKHS